ncbi:MAG: hypothetical protein JWM37_60 [Candidatus Saccharibacteria bacterium]|nr:hypothetical protein [Candidatus Saccharibacteria bacterium]
MILTGSEITKQVRSGAITIAPFSEELVNPNSYNYRLGSHLLEITDDVIDPKAVPNYKSITLTDEGYLLTPGTLYLASTLEKIGSNQFVTSLIGRSSVGRLGLFLQITADLGHLGAIHHWTLELKVVQPLRVYPKMKIGQVSFWSTTGSKRMLYAGKYHAHDKPHHSKLYEELLEESEPTI